MQGEKDLAVLLKTMKPVLNQGEFVFCSVKDLSIIDVSDVVGLFREGEGITVIVKKEIADQLSLNYSSAFAWISLTVHSSLEAVGLTAAFAKALADHSISCNVIAGYYHDHIFVAQQDAKKAMKVLGELSKRK